MPRAINPKPCGCGCGAETRGGDFLPGHDQRLRAMLEEKVGGLLNLKEIVERATGESLDCDLNAMVQQIMDQGNQWETLAIQRNKGNKFRVMRSDWSNGSLWIEPRTSDNTYQVALTGDAIEPLMGRMWSRFGEVTYESRGYPLWRIPANDLGVVLQAANDLG